jgi:glycosyltransferase involved in cell wall biosynthesis
MVCPAISAALIVRNEERFLEDCLRSLAGHVDEVVIVDTGSTDRSIEIAKDHGAKLHHFAWTGDFSAARNHGLDRCGGDWILYIDADERLGVSPPHRLPDLIQHEAWVGATVRFRPKTGYTRYLEPRLFRRDPRLRFVGKIHETYHAEMIRIAEAEGLAIGNCPARLDHLGYDGDQSHKHPRNLALLKEAVLTSPDRVFLWYHLAETLAALGQIDEAMLAAQNGTERARGDGSLKSRVDASMIYQLVARLDLDSGRDPRGLVEEGLAALPDDHALRFLAARREAAFGDAATALKYLDRLLSIDPSTLDDGLIAFDTRIFGSLAEELKIAILMKLGRQAEASMLAASLARRAVNPG